MSKSISIILTFVLSALFLNCQPKPAEKTTPGVDSVVVKKTEVATISEAKSSVFFRAVGTEPFWEIEIAADSIRFRATEKKDNFSLLYQKSQKTLKDNLTIYRAKSENIDLEITIQQAKCRDGMSEKEFGYSVKISLRRDDQKELFLSGCGNYVIDYRLHDIWALEELEGKKINQEDFKEGVPNLEIYAEEARFSGMAGCNRIGGKLLFDNGSLRFAAISTTEMMCESYETEKALIKALQNTTRYDLKENKLYLLNQDGTKAVFKKVD